ncbi:MAG TPA: hypothetical protein DCP55_01855 [Chitinophagaceae bacterium]|nr:hypothetical protein [Pseudomonadota bacterium]HAL94725.1 hypothetical protein [Chitinophagaceae bacterium]
MKPFTRIIKPGVTEKGFFHGIKDYKDESIIEELCANSYDADASCVLVFFDGSDDENKIYLIDDGKGFSDGAIESVAKLGGGDDKGLTNECFASSSGRPYLGLFGYGLKSVFKISRQLDLYSANKTSTHEISIEKNKIGKFLDAGKDEGFVLKTFADQGHKNSGTKLALHLSTPISNERFKELVNSVSNLPTDDGKIQYYIGLTNKENDHIFKEIDFKFPDFENLKNKCKRLADAGRVQKVIETSPSSLKKITPIVIEDKENDVICRIYFNGYESNKVRSLYTGLRGIYVRIHGRLLKKSFDDQKYVYNISKWNSFAAGLRVEIDVDWLHNQVSLSREGLVFENPKLENEFKKVLAKNISKFISKELKKKSSQIEKGKDREHKNRINLAERRANQRKEDTYQKIKDGFNFRPENDAEIALCLANPHILRLINPDLVFVSFNTKSPVDLILFDRSRRMNIFCETEPTVADFSQHKHVPDYLNMLVTKSLGPTKIGKRLKGRKFCFEICPDNEQTGRYKLLLFKSTKAKTSFQDIPLFILDEVLM